MSTIARLGDTRMLANITDPPRRGSPAASSRGAQLLSLLLPLLLLVLLAPLPLPSAAHL